MIHHSPSGFEPDNTSTAEEKSSPKISEDRVFIAVLLLGIGIGAWVGWLIPVF